MQDQRQYPGTVHDRRSEPWHMDKRVPISLILALLIQTGSFIWWAAGVSFELRDHERRIMSVETFNTQVTVSLGGIGDRMARVEEKLSAQSDTLNRIETYLRNKK